MEEGQATERGHREIAISMPHEVPIRDSAPPTQSSRTFEASYATASTSHVPPSSRPQAAAEVWSGAISRLQTQYSLNTSMLESHRRQLQDVETAVRNLNHEMGKIATAVYEIQAELQRRPSVAEPPRQDPGDLEVLAGQLEAVTTKANEVDALKMQVELMKNRIKRWEEQGGPLASTARPSSVSTNQDSSLHEAPPHPSHHAAPGHFPQLPPMRTSAMMSPIENRASPYATHPLPPHSAVLESHGGPSHRPPPDPRQHSADSSGTLQSSAGTFTPGEPLPPPATLPGWLPAEPHHHPSSVAPPPLQPGPVRPHAMEPEPQGSGWAAVNANQKRPYEEPRPTRYESPIPGSPKRPKLAPIMPRSSYGDDSYVPSQTDPVESSIHSRSRAPSDGSLSQTQSMQTPSSASAPSYRFITTSNPATDSQDSWRPENERMLHMHHHHAGPGPGHHHGGRRGGGRGGRGRGRRGRGGGVQLPDTQELGTPEWERSDWSGSQISPNGYYHPLHRRGGLARRSGGVAGGPPEREQEFPATPVSDPNDPYAGPPDSAQGSGSKKTRTKPIRNAEGVLIRKDGRPDMRSVSSANNLRKVHAKKEAERAEMEGRTPTSARSLAPANLYSDEEGASHSGTPGTPIYEGEDEDVQNTQGRHEELMSKIFPRGATEIGNGGMTTAERFFPRPEAHETVLKSEAPQSDNQSASQMTDVVMREMSEAQSAEHQAGLTRDNDAKMETVEERNEEREGGPTQDTTTIASEQTAA